MSTITSLLALILSFSIHLHAIHSDEWIRQTGQLPVPADQQIRITLIDTDFSSSGHGNQLKKLILEIAPFAQIRTLQTDPDLNSLLVLLGTIPAESVDMLVFGFGHEGYSDDEYRVLLEFQKHDIAIFAPAGNSADTRSYFPANYPFVFTAASCDAQGILPVFPHLMNR